MSPFEKYDFERINPAKFGLSEESSVLSAKKWPKCRGAMKTSGLGRSACGPPCTDRPKHDVFRDPTFNRPPLKSDKCGLGVRIM